MLVLYGISISSGVVESIINEKTAPNVLRTAVFGAVTPPVIYKQPLKLNRGEVAVSALGPSPIGHISDK